MNPLSDNGAFWCSNDCYLAVNPRQLDDSSGLAEFAAASDGLAARLFFQTSGSEGSPKWVGLSRAAFLASARAVNSHLEATPRDRWLIALPLHHVGGFSILARCHGNGAGFFHWQERWDPIRFAAVCAAEGISLTSLVPAQVFDLVQAKLEAPPSLRAVVVGGGSLDRELGNRARDLGWQVLQSYGMTETASQVATEPLAHLRQGFDPDHLEVLPGWEVRSDADGRLIVRGDALAAGYAVRENAGWRWEPIDRESGWRARDRVELWSHEARRYLRFLGRDADFVKVLGELVNIAALQRRLDDLLAGLSISPGAAAIWPVPDERAGNRLVLASAIPPGEIEELRARFNATAQGFERLDSARQIGAIPRTPLGKIDRAALDELLAG
jgi:o-succinylbenzoate---CoA ligase